MKFSIRFADQIVGTLVILALAIIVAVIFMLGKNQRWFSRDYQYKSYFNSASGINLNMPIQYKGFTIGHVKKIRLTEEDKVEVLFNIFEEHNHRVKEGSMVEVQASPIGLGNTFMFHPGKGRNQLAEGELIPEVGSAEARRLVEAGLADALESSDRISQIIIRVDTLLDTINMALEGSQGADKTELGRIVSNVRMATGSIGNAAGSIDDVTKALSVKLVPILDNIEVVTTKLSDPSGSIMSILDGDGPVYNDLTEILDSISGILKSLDSTFEFIPAQLPQVAILISDLHSALTEAEKLIIALLNNPLLRGGVPEIKETGPGAATPRDLEF